MPTVRGNLGANGKIAPVAPSLEGHGLIAREAPLAQVFLYDTNGLASLVLNSFKKGCFQTSISFTTVFYFQATNFRKGLSPLQPLLHFWFTLYRLLIGLPLTFRYIKKYIYNKVGICVRKLTKAN